MSKSKFVRIQSDITIQVTEGNTYQDVTNPNARTENRLKVNPMWTKTVVLIKQGAGIYPSEIAEWPTVKALVANKSMSIQTNVSEDEIDDVAKAKAAELKLGKEEITERTKGNTSKGKAPSLDDIAGN